MKPFFPLCLTKRGVRWGSRPGVSLNFFECFSAFRPDTLEFHDFGASWPDFITVLLHVRNLFLNSPVFPHYISMFKPRLRLGHLSTIRTTPIRRFATEARLTSDHVRIVEVGPRDGLQNEKKSISLDTKLELISKLARTGVTTIEAGSFVPAKWVPQVCPRVRSAPNRDGWQRSTYICPMLIHAGF